MEVALTIMLLQGVLGAFDTLYYHEYKYSLPVHGPKVGAELKLHAFRDYVYGILFLSLPFVRWEGVLALILVALIATEVCITIWDFNVEVIVRKDIGGVANSERGLHLIMAIVYGYFLAHLIPEILKWWKLPTGFGSQEPLPALLVLLSVIFGIGVLISGLRDIAAAHGRKSFQRDLFAFARRVH